MLTRDVPSFLVFRRRGVGGFSLLELLVAMVVLGILAVVAVVGFAGAGVAARRVACAGNMREIGHGIRFYAYENGGWMPTTAHTEFDQSWIFLLQPILGDSFDRVRICPADPRGAERLENGGTSYLLNEFTSVDLEDGEGRVLESYRNLNRLQSPGETPVLFVAADTVGLGMTNDHTHSRNWRAWRNVLADIAPDRHLRGEPADDRTRGSANYLFADGRVENIPAAELKANYFDRGINFASPPEIRGRVR